MTLPRLQAGSGVRSATHNDWVATARWPGGRSAAAAGLAPTAWTTNTTVTSNVADIATASAYYPPGPSVAATGACAQADRQ